jgi:prolyl oligopeptidase
MPFQKRAGIHANCSTTLKERILMKMFLRSCIAIFLFALVTSVQVHAQSISEPPAAPKRPVTDDYLGTKVTDDYRWLENWDDLGVKQWSAAENARTREYLDHLPSRSAVKDKLQKLIAASSDSYSNLQFRDGMLFASKYHPPQQQPVLVVMRSADDPASAKVIYDPNSSAARGSLAVDFYVPSFAGKYVAAALSENGSEDSSAHILEVATGKEMPDVVPRVNFATAGGSIAWKADNSGFYYTRYPQGKERPAEDANFYQQVYFHKLGTDPKQDTYVIGKEFPRIAEILLTSSEDGHWLLASVANGDGGQFAHYVMDSSGKWTQITRFEDGIVSVKFGADDGLYLLSRKDYPRGQIWRLPPGQLNFAQAKLVVRQSSGSGSDESNHASIEYFVPAPGHLYVVDIMGGPSRVRVFDEQSNSLPAPQLPKISAVDQIISIGGGNALFFMATYLEPPAWYRFDAASGKATRTALYRTSPVKFDDTEVVREFAISKDGTRVPVNIIRRKGINLDGSNPTILYGYGGYGISEKPFFAGYFARIWLDQGGVFAYVNLRGGAEYGEEWHQAGALTHKQNVFDDFLTAAQFMITQGYTSPAHLAIMGGSNGGLLMGAAFTQRPELFRAVVSYVGIYDMLRVELDPNGAFNVTEFGTVKDPDQFKALYAYSPYHHVKDGTAYPAILMFTGENDHRVNPMQSRKMIARLQATNSSGHPILLRTTSSAGHGIGTALDEQIEQDADFFSFLFDQLGIKYSSAAN